MTGKKTKTNEQEFLKAIDKAKEEKYFLRLYVTGVTTRSMKEILNVRKL